MKKEGKGFTMIEMCVVLVLMCILGAAVIPSMEMIYKQDLNKAANAICLDLVTIRRQAELTSIDYTLTMTDTKSYTMTHGTNAQDAIRVSNTDNSKNIVYTLNNGNPLNSILFSKGKMYLNGNTATNQTDKVEIKVTYSGAKSYIEIVFYSTGQYTITMKQ